MLRIRTAVTGTIRKWAVLSILTAVGIRSRRDKNRSACRRGMIPGPLFEEQMEAPPADRRNAERQKENPCQEEGKPFRHDSEYPGSPQRRRNFPRRDFGLSSEILALLFKFVNELPAGWDRKPFHGTGQNASRNGEEC